MDSGSIAPRQRERDNKTLAMINALVLDGISSAHTRRSYSQALEEFVIWFHQQAEGVFNKAAVQKYRVELERKGLSPSSVNVRLSAIRRLAMEAADNGLLGDEVAGGIGRVHGAKQSGGRLGNWLTKEMAERLLAAPDLRRVKGVRDRALLALLLAAGLRRSELASLSCEHIQQRDGRWLIADLVGKHNRIRTVPLPEWAHHDVSLWQQTAGIANGPIFRRVTRHGKISSASLSPQAVFTIVRSYANVVGIPIRPHDLRRTFAKLAYNGQSRLEQIQFSLGHASLVTTELYLGCKQDLSDAPCDHLGLAVFSTEA